MKTDNNAQMLIIASITIAVLIVALGAITASLSNVSVNLPREKSYAIYSKYLDIREKFGTALYQRLYSVSNEDMILSIFSDTFHEFYSLVNRYGYYFDAEFIEITYGYDDQLDSIKVKLSYSSDISSVNEEVEYNIW